MSTYLSLHYHVVFSTRNRVASLDAQWRNRLFEYMGGTVRGPGGYPQGVGGWIDHVHLLFGLKATHVLADVVREIKKASTAWVRDEVRLAGFQWQEGYGAFTVGYRERDRIKRYIANQEDHHRAKTYLHEVEALYREAEIEFDPKYLV